MTSCYYANFFLSPALTQHNARLATRFYSEGFSVHAFTHFALRLQSLHRDMRTLTTSSSDSWHKVNKHISQSVELDSSGVGAKHDLCYEAKAILYCEMCL